MSSATTLSNAESISNQIPAFERWFVITVLVLCGGAFVNLFLSPEAVTDSGAGMPAFRFAWAVIDAIAITLFIQKCRGGFRALMREYFVALLVILAITSSIWSTSPAVTFRRSVSLAAFTLFAAYFARRFSIREQMQLLVCSFGLCVGFSYLFGILGLGESVNGIGGAWFGIYTQRNGLGSVMSLAILIFLLAGKIDRETRYRSWFLGMAALGLVVLSGSMTSLIVSLIAIASIPLIRVLRATGRDRWLLLGAAAMLCLSVWRVAASFDSVAEAMGRDSSLTGRVEVWVASTDLGREKPWFGYGYNAFWVGLDGPSATVWRIAGWAAPSAHNGVLETWLDLGIVGASMAVFGVAFYLRKAYRVVRSTKKWEYAFPLMFLVLLCFQNITESAFLGGNSIHWFLYVVAALNLGQLEEQIARVIGAKSLLKKSVVRNHLVGPEASA